MMKLKASSIGYKTTNGDISDIVLHEEIMSGADDTVLRLMSARRAVAEFWLTREEAEAAFGVQLPPDFIPP